MELFNFVQALTVLHDLTSGLPVNNGCHSGCERTQKWAEVKEKARLEDEKVRKKLRKLKNVKEATSYDLNKVKGVE